MPRDLVGAANENVEIAFLRLAENATEGATRQFGPVTVTSAGLPDPFYNRVFVFESTSHNEFAAAVAWMEDRDLPYKVTVTEPLSDTVERLTSDLEFTKAGTLPGMALPTLDTIPSSESTATITEITSHDDLDGFAQVVASVFEMPGEIAEDLSQAALAADGNRLFLGSVDGQPAASGLSIPTGAVVGVYMIGVVEAFRRQGIGQAMSWEVLRAGRDAGCRIGVLQSSEMAVSLYKQMGFETVVTYHQFEPTT